MRQQQRRGSAKVKPGQRRGHWAPLLLLRMCHLRYHAWKFLGFILKDSFLAWKNLTETTIYTAYLHKLP